MINGNITQHDRVQYTAYKWLQEQGYSCQMETILQIEAGKWYRVDVIGYKANETIAIECGYSTNRKLRRLYKIVNKLYIWELNSSKPILYSDILLENTSICNSCGCLRVNPIYLPFNREEFLANIYKKSSNSDSAKSKTIIPLTENMFSVEQASIYLNISRGRISKFASRGILVGTNTSNHKNHCWRFTKENLDNFANKLAGKIAWSN